MRTPLVPIDQVPHDFIGLYPASRRAVPAPLFAIGLSSRELEREYYAQTDVPAVGVFRPRSVSVTSHNLLVWNDRFVESPSLSLYAASIEECALYGELRADRIPSRTLHGPTVPLAGPGHLIYGHWLADFLPKLFVLAKAGFALETLTYLLPANTPRFAHGLLAQVGIPAARIETFDPYAETVTLAEPVVPTMLRLASRTHPAFTEAARYIGDRLPRQPGAHPPPSRRLFLSRAKAGRDDGRLLVNRQEIERLAVDGGYEIVDPGQLSFPDQVETFRQADRIVGEYGSALHGSIFAPRGARVCALRALASHPGFLQSGLCEALGQEIGYVFGDCTQEGHQQRFSIPEESFAKALSQLDSRRWKLPSLAALRSVVRTAARG